MQNAPRTPQEITSTREKSRREEHIVMDPRFVPEKFNAVRHYDNYKFLYEKEKEVLSKRTKNTKEIKSAMSRMEARERYMRMKQQEQKRREEELERVVAGKKPYYMSNKQKKIEEAVEKAKEKGAVYVISKLKKKTKEKDNRTRKIVDGV